VNVIVEVSCYVVHYKSAFTAVHSHSLILAWSSLFNNVVDYHQDCRQGQLLILSLFGGWFFVTGKMPAGYMLIFRLLVGQFCGLSCMGDMLRRWSEMCRARVHIHARFHPISARVGFRTPKKLKSLPNFRI